MLVFRFKGKQTCPKNGGQVQLQTLVKQLKIPLAWMVCSISKWPSDLTALYGSVDTMVRARADTLTDAHPELADQIAATIATWPGVSAVPALIAYAAYNGESVTRVVDACLLCDGVNGDCPF
jgi:hypothetical protein